MSGCETNFPVDCPMCGKGVEVEKLYFWWVTCDGCYDGAPDAGPQLAGWGRTRSGAVDDWNEQVADYESDRDDARLDLETDRKIDEARGK